MSAPSEHEAYLRAALRAAADSLEPRGDGLELIRTRLQHARPRAVIWLLAAWDALWLRAPAALQDAVYRVSAVLWAAWDRFGPAQAPGKHRSRTQSMLRPLAAMGVVMFIVAAGTYVAIDISTAVSPSSSNSNPGNGPAGTNKGGTAPSSSANRTYEGSATRQPNSSPTANCSTAPAPQASSSPQSSASPSASPSPSDTSSPSPTPTDTSGGTGAVVSAEQLTTARQTPCPSPSSNGATPNPSTDAGAPQTNQTAVVVPPPSPSPSTTGTSRDRHHRR